MIRVAIADDQTMVRASFRLLLEQDKGVQVVGEASTGGEAVAVARRELPDIVLMDIQMPQMDGIEATRLICRSARTPHTRVIMLTTFDLRQYVVGALQAGASAFLLKHGHPDELLAAIPLVHAGESILAPSATRQLIEAFVARPDSPAAPTRSLDTLTEREQEVLRLVAEGLSNTEITDRLRVTMPTVKSHVGKLLTKLDARDRVHLVIAAYEAGLVRPGNAEIG
ncbi:response regulator transcription factor [Actinoplanes sp. NPDC051633]|uniref:response regulator transcription factor n=1 Tax=Actinoplanes sp. NPDC051633 TaxID=3155670 RepID=UPI0034172E60